MVAPTVFGQQERLSYAAWGEFLHGGERETRRRPPSPKPFDEQGVPWGPENPWEAQLGYMAEGRAEHSKYGFLLGYDITPRDRLDVLGNHLEKFNNYNGRPISFEEVTGDLFHVTFTRQIHDDLKLTVLGDFLNTTYDGPADAAPAHPDSADRVTKMQVWPNRELGMKVMFSGRGMNRHEYSAGLEWRRNTNETTRWYGDRDVLEQDVTGTQDIYSVFVEDKLRFGDLEVTPGVRVEQWKDNTLYTRQGDAVEDLNGDGLPDRTHAGYVEGRDTREAVNPKVGVAYFLSESLKLRGSVGSTFRAPRITETYSPDYQTLSVLLYRSNLDLEEERIVSYEAGFDYQSPDRRVDLSLTGFLIDARDRIEFTFFGGFTVEDPYVIEHKNFDQEITGVEGQVGVQLAESIGAGANFSFVNPEYTSGAFDGNSPPGVPDHTINAHIDWNPRSDLSARLAVQRIGTIWDDNANTVTRDDDKDIIYTAELDPYSLLNLKVRYEIAFGASESAHLDAELTNLLDKDYDIYSNGVWDYKPLGRALHLGVGYRF